MRAFISAVLLCVACGPTAAPSGAHSANAGQPDDTARTLERAKQEIANGHHHEALSDFRTACAAGLAEGCREAARLLRAGEHVPRDPVAAKDLAARGCELKDAASCRVLALLHLGGPLSAAANPEIVARAYQAACDLKDSDGCQSLGWLHLYGIGVSRDVVAAVRYFKAECDTGTNLGACTAYFTALLQGTGIPANEPLAASKLDELCQRGISTSCAMVGLVDEQGLAGRSQDPGRAAERFRASCAAGAIDGCLFLGRLLLARPQTKRDEAAQLLRKACDGFRGEACALLADLDPANSNELNQRACMLGVEARCGRK